MSIPFSHHLTIKIGEAAFRPDIIYLHNKIIDAGYGILNLIVCLLCCPHLRRPHLREAQRDMRTLGAVSKQEAP
jgi:hypothetical protein